MMRTKDALNGLDFHFKVLYLCKLQYFLIKGINFVMQVKEFAEKAEITSAPSRGGTSQPAKKPDSKSAPAKSAPAKSAAPKSTGNTTKPPSAEAKKKPAAGKPKSPSSSSDAAKTKVSYAYK